MARFKTFWTMLMNENLQCNDWEWRHWFYLLSTLLECHLPILHWHLDIFCNSNNKQTKKRKNQTLFCKEFVLFAKKNHLSPPPLPSIQLNKAIHGDPDPSYDTDERRFCKKSKQQKSPSLLYLLHTTWWGSKVANNLTCPAAKRLHVFEEPLSFLSICHQEPKTLQEWVQDPLQRNPSFKVAQKWLQSMKYIQFNSDLCQTMWNHANNRWKHSNGQIHCFFNVKLALWG